MSVFAQLFWMGTPYWVLAILALLTTGKSAAGGFRVLWMRNRFAGYGVAFLLLVVGATIAMEFTLWRGGCTGGFIDPVKCAHLSVATGALLNDLVLKALTTTSAIGLPSLGAFAAAEALTRLRQWQSKRSST